MNILTLVGIAILATLALADPDHSRGHHAVSHGGSYGHHGYGKREAEPSYGHGHGGYSSGSYGHHGYGKREAEPSYGHGHGGYSSGSYGHHGYGKRKLNHPTVMDMVVTLLEAMDIMDMESGKLNLPTVMDMVVTLL
nr:holotricin-3-like isoform X2 [Lepeophtheirus salmonis]